MWKFEGEYGFLVLNKGESYEAAVWQIPELYGQSNSPQLECIASLDGHASKIKRVLWWPSGRHDKLISIDEQNIFLWSLDSSKKSAQSAGTDSAVNLWFAIPPTNDELTSDSMSNSGSKTESLLHSYSDYEDSVYGLSWSSREPWLFASLSYDGRVVLESIKPHLPKK